ncbi:hypothetical protein [Nostoc sp. CALU 1950]|uniref:hypothetical protein n=1 Tax=Nostoc sp. CALU 1950 TaxID=3104321 RepID=UPI003EBDBEAA
MSSYAFCDKDSDFFPIFGDAIIPILSTVPIIPPDYGAPPCYVVLGKELSEDIRQQLAIKLFEMWQPGFKSIQMVQEYILQGLPLSTTNFSGVKIDDDF